MTDGTSKARIIASLKQQALDRLKPCLLLVIEDTADYLFSLSTSARLDPANQNECYDAFLILQGETKRVVADMCASVSRAFDVIHTPPVADTADIAAENIALELLDLEIFEETLAIEKIVKASTERFWIDLESLMFRLGILFSVPADGITLPVSPHLLCSAYRQSMRDIAFPQDFLVDADSAFVRKLLPELAAIYASLNQTLRHEGLLPDIESELTQTGSKLLINRRHRNSDPQQDISTPGELSTAAPSASPDDVSVNRVETVRFIHETDWVNTHSIGITSSSVNATPFVRKGALSAAVPTSQLQAAGGKQSFLPSRIQPPDRDVDARNRLLASAEQLLDDRATPSLEMESENLRIAGALAQARARDTISRASFNDLLSLINFEPQPAVLEQLKEAHNLSARLFDYLLQRVLPSEEQIYAFAKLELCFLELALVDSAFLIDGDHPGRILVDRLTDLATLFPRGDDKYLTKLVSVIEDLAYKFDGTKNTITSANNTLSDLSVSLIKQQRQNKERLITREKATDKIDSSRFLLIEALNNFFTERPPKHGVVKAICEVFIERWVVALLKGKSIGDIVSDLEILYDTASEKANSSPPNEVNPRVSSLLGPNFELTSSVVKVLSELHLDTDLQSPIPDNWGLDIDLKPLELEELVAKRPRLRRATETLQKLAIDTWFKQELTNGYRYLQVVWINRHGTRLVLSNERGLKQRDLSILEFATELDRSLKRLSTFERLSLVEQTLFSKLSAVQSDISQRFSSSTKDALTSLTYELERALRRVRRSGASIQLASFVLANDQSTAILEQEIELKDGVAGSVFRLSDDKACILGSFEPDDLRSILEQAYGPSAHKDLKLITLSNDDTNDPNRIIEKLALGEPAHGDNFGTPTNVISAPIRLEQAIEAAVTELTPLVNTLRLRTVLRVPVAGGAVETAYRLEGFTDCSDLGMTDHKIQQRHLRIASNITEIGELCRLLRQCEQQRARPHLILKLHPDTCLYAGTQDQILSLISEHAIGTSQLTFMLSDSLQLRDSSTCQRLTRALRSIGCHVVLDNYSPERVTKGPSDPLNASEVVIEPIFWERAAQQAPWKNLLPQLITDTHHILGQSVSVRDPVITKDIELTGVDYVERSSDVLLSMTELLRSLSPELS